MSPKRDRDNSEFLSMLRRMLRAYSERVAQADDWDLAEMLTLRDEVDTAITNAVHGLRSQGHSWAYIAVALGTTRQAAQQRYGRSRAQTMEVGDHDC